MKNKSNEIAAGGISKLQLAELTSDLVASYVAHNPVSLTDLPDLISEVYKKLSSISSETRQTSKEDSNQKPAVPVKKSIGDDFIICLEDGKKFKSLKRHLNSHFGLSPEEYRAKWGLPADYPMVAPNYAKERSRLAKKIGLGRQTSSRGSKAA